MMTMSTTDRRNGKSHVHPMDLQAAENQIAPQYRSQYFREVLALAERFALCKRGNGNGNGSGPPYVERPPLPGQGLRVLTADQILATEWRDPAWAIEGLLPGGLGILGGAPKIGKSLLALQIALAVASGGRVFNVKVDQGPVLYLALEDSPRRLKERMLKMNWPRGLPAEFMTIGEFATQIGPLSRGGWGKLAQYIKERQCRFVAIDTLARVIRGDQMDPDQMTRGLEPLQQLAHQQNSSLLLLDHHRKASGVGQGGTLDAIGDILGSTSKGGVADTAWGLYRERGKAGAKLQITGRDVEERTLQLRIDWETLYWQCDGDADEIARQGKSAELRNILADLGPLTGSEAASAAGQDLSNASPHCEGT
jgi:hypothetical protein